MQQGRETHEAMLMDSGNECPWLWGPVNACHVRIHGRGDPSMRVTIVRRRALEKHIFLQDRKSDCPQESCVSPRRNCPWTKFRSFQLIIITFPTLDLSTGRLASTKRKFLWTALLLIDIKNDPRNFISTYYLWESGSKTLPKMCVDKTPSIKQLLVHGHFLLFSSLHRIKISYEYITTAVCSASTVAHVRDDTRCYECICV